jgi:hypothetical protein
LNPDDFTKSGWDVITGAFISVKQSSPKEYERCSNLWYTNLGKDEYRWWEVTYMTNLSGNTDQLYEPFCLNDFKLADSAAGSGLDIYQLGASPIPIDGEHFQSFCERWAELFAKAYREELEQPRNLPLR